MIWNANMTNDKTISGLGEFGLIDRINSRVEKTADVITGIGDDAAVTAISPAMQLLTSTDMLLEDVHFRLSWHDPYRLGRKSLAVSISDIAAMGGLPRWALLSLAIPTVLPVDFLDDFTRGFLDMAAEHGVCLIGGDTCSSRKGLVISVTIMGEQQPERILRRSGAKPGDEIWVTGTLGDAAHGLRLLESGSSNVEEDETIFVSRLLDPTPRVSAGLALAESGLVNAMIDVSDGIIADFGHIAGQSSVGGRLRLDNLPLSPSFLRTCGHDRKLPYHLALSGGEDYELCFTAPPENHEKIIACVKKCGVEATPVGIVTSSPEVVAVHVDGTPYNLPNKGFNHFT